MGTPNDLFRIGEEWRGKENENPLLNTSLAALIYERGLITHIERQGTPTRGYPLSGLIRSVAEDLGMKHVYIENFKASYHGMEWSDLLDYITITIIWTAEGVPNPMLSDYMMRVYNGKTGSDP